MEKIPGYIDKYKYYILALASLGVYAQVIGFGLVYCDDHDIILTYYDRIRSFGNISGEMFRGYIGTEYYRPVINLSFMIDAQIAGQNPWIYHLSNIIYHLLSVLFLYKLLEKTGIARQAAFAAAALFAVHPLNANAVAWIVGRNDTIMALFSILAFINLINYSIHGKNRYAVFYGLFTLLSALSKESGIFFIPVAFFYLVIVKKEPLKSKTVIAGAAVSMLAAALWFAARSNAELGNSINNMGFDVFLFNLRVIPEYIGKFFLPYDTSVLATFSLKYTATGIIIIVLLASLMVYLSKSRKLNYPMIIFGALWFVLPLLPTMFVSIINVNDWNEYVECRAYLPIIGLFIIIIELLPKNSGLFSSKALIAVIVVLAVFAGITVAETRNYKDSATFYEAAISDNPHKALFHFVLSRRYRDAGMYGKEEQSIRRAMALRQDYAKYPYNLGVFFYRHKDYDSALKYLNLALALNPKYKEAYKPLGMIYYNSGDFNSAYRVWEQAGRYLPDAAEYEVNSAAALFMGGSYTRLDSLLTEFKTQNKYEAELYGYFLSAGDSYAKSGNYRVAVRAYNYCILLNSKYLDPYFKLLAYYTEKEQNKAKAQYYYNFILNAGEKIPPDLEKKYANLQIQ